MRFATRIFPPAIALALAVVVDASETSFTEMLRTAALANGLLPTNQLFVDTDLQLASLGKQFFESENLSINGRISCRTCHLDNFSTTDGLPNAVGIFGFGEGPKRALSQGKIVPRNTLPLWGRGGKSFDVFFWDGKVDFSSNKTLSQFGLSVPSSDSLLTAVHLPPVEIREMIDDDNDISTFKTESSEQAGQLYRRIVERLFATEYELMGNLANRLGKQITDLEFLDVARSIAAFIRSEFRLRDTLFHRFVFGNGNLTPGELQGGLIFYGKGKCVNCHTGPYFSDFGFHAVPFPQLGFGKNGFGVDYGRFNVTFNPSDLYKFRTPPLINVAKTPPYGHSGSIPTLRDAVVAHFDPIGFLDLDSMDLLARHEQFRRMAAVSEDFKLISVLNDHEVTQVVSFLETLSFRH
ncbi:MAG: His-Xaa-Ser system-associated MauG-like protein [Albidovulum sp.]|nr:His-Xaa-Ser system-associated MauG-like protein [Albidovulum sp.]